MEMPVKQAVPFSFTNPYAWPRRPLLSANVVSTSQPLAAQAGLQMLAAGGNASTQSSPPRSR
jgi:gamma-glutamyltranspeptidase/glutathione hydrolase